MVLTKFVIDKILDESFLLVLVVISYTSILIPITLNFYLIDL
jgi:hypothetical protein